MDDAPSLFDPMVAPFSPSASPETSKAAAVRVGPTANSDERVIISAMWKIGRPVTAAEIATKVNCGPPNQVAARLWSLRGEVKARRPVPLVEWARDSDGKIRTAPTRGRYRGRLQRLTSEGWRIAEAYERNRTR